MDSEDPHRGRGYRRQRRHQRHRTNRVYNRRDRNRQVRDFQIIAAREVSEGHTKLVINYGAVDAILALCASRMASTTNMAYQLKGEIDSYGENALANQIMGIIEDTFLTETTGYPYQIPQYNTEHEEVVGILCDCSSFFLRVGYIYNLTRELIQLLRMTRVRHGNNRDTGKKRKNAIG